MVDSTNLPEVDINAIATDLNNKADRDLVNATVPYVMSRTANSYGGVVEIWSDGYCVQNGFISMYATGTNINLSQEYINTSYNVLISFGGSDCRENVPAIYGKTVNKFQVVHTAGLDNNFGLYFKAEGYIR